MSEEDFELLPDGIFTFDRTWRLAPIREVQDGLIANELTFVMYLWNRGRAGDAQDNFRIVSIGDRRLAGELGLAYMTVRNLTAALQDKLVIVVRSAAGTGPKSPPKTFIVFSFAEILRRWKKAGMVQFMRRNGSRVLCGADGTIIAPKVIATKVSGRALTDVAITVSRTAPTVRATDQSSIAPTVRANTLNEENPNQPAPPAEEVARVIRVLTRFLQETADQAYACDLIGDCREAAREATVDEICCFIDTTLPSLLDNPRIESKTGTLRFRARQAFQPLSYQQLRARTSEWRKLRATKIYQHPDAWDPEDRQWAESILLEEQGGEGN